MRLFDGHSLFPNIIIATAFAAMTSAPVTAQNIYGTNSSGQSCIANGVDCSAPMTYGPVGPGRRVYTTKYAAFAGTIDKGTAWGLAYDHASKAAAERMAVALCNKQAARRNACKSAGWFTGSCAVFVQDQGNAWSVRFADNARKLKDAEKRALRACSDQPGAGRCKLVESHCQN